MGKNIEVQFELLSAGLFDLDGLAIFPCGYIHGNSFGLDFGQNFEHVIIWIVRQLRKSDGGHCRASEVCAQSSKVIIRRRAPVISGQKMLNTWVAGAKEEINGPAFGPDRGDGQ